MFKIIGNKNFYFILLMVFILVLSGCSKYESDSAEYPNIAHEELKSSPDMEENYGENNGGLNDRDVSNKTLEKPNDKNVDNKIIKNSYIELETLKFEETTNSIVGEVSKIGGYIEESNISGSHIRNKYNEHERNAYLKLRIPKEHYDSFLLTVNDIGNVITKKDSSRDITSSYFDTEAHLNALRIQEERLLEILKKAVELKDILELERELTNVRYQIESFTGTLKKWDNLVDYATIEVHVYEVYEISEVEEKPKTLIDKIKNSFKTSVEMIIDIFKGLLILSAGIIPFTVIIIPVLVIIIILLKSKKNRLKQNKEDKNDKIE